MSSHTEKNSRGSALVIALTVVAVLVIIGAIAYALLAKNGGSSLKNLFHKTITATTADEVRTLLSDAKAGKYDVKCTYNIKSVESTLYIKGDDKMRVDTVITDKPGHVLRLDESVYLWAEGNPKGSRLPVTKEDSDYTPDGFANKVEESKAKCQSVGSLDESLFAVPSDVEFEDFHVRPITTPARESN
jgi:hypothetical protein